MDYPRWICSECGAPHLASKSQQQRVENIATFHMPDRTNPEDRCGWCGSRDCELTEPRTYGNPLAPGRPPP